MADQRQRDIRPAELAALINFAERPRAQEWSLRAAISRYAQPEPQRASDFLDVIRRIEFALPGEMALVERDGPELWQALRRGVGGESGRTARVLGLLRSIAEIDQLGDTLATWAVDRAGERPNAAVDAVTAGVAQRLVELGVPKEERPPPARRRG